MSADSIGTAASRAMTERAFDIEKKSFEIINSEAGDHGYSPAEWAVVSRVIHSTADFDFCRSGRIDFRFNPIDAAYEAFANKRPVITDVEMVLSAINKKSLQDLGISARCYISNPDVILRAKEQGLTRSEAAMRFALGEMQGGIVAIGNAPTALMKLVELINGGTAAPALVVGLPVGFVSAAESKEALARTKVPHITNTGRKGGSPAASSIINALMLLYKARLSS